MERILRSIDRYPPITPAFGQQLQRSPLPAFGTAFRSVRANTPLESAFPFFPPPLHSSATASCYGVSGATVSLEEQAEAPSARRHQDEVHN